MNCGFCGKSYEEDRSQRACKACPLGSDCGLILCPHCGYENPGTPRWISFLKDRFGRKSPEMTAPPPTVAITDRRSLPVLDSSFGPENRT